MGKTLSLIFLIALAIVIGIVVYINGKKKYSLDENPKYSISRIENIEMGGKSWSNCSFYLNGRYLSSYTRIIKNSERNQFLGKRFLVKYDSTNIENAKILIDFPVPDSVTKAPINGWEEMPEWAN